MARMHRKRCLTSHGMSPTMYAHLVVLAGRQLPCRWR